MSILSRQRTENRGHPYVIAHRGNRALHPENTLTAFRRALEDGADIVETDIRVTRDQAFVCIHDATLDRTTSGSGKVARLTLAEIRQHTASGGGGGDERVPTLEEFVVGLPDPVVLALELKSVEFRSASVCKRLVDELERLNVLGRVMMLSSRRSSLKMFRTVAPEIPLGLVAWLVPWPVRGVDLLGPLWPILFVNPWYVRWAHARGQLVCPLDPAPDRRLRWYHALRCDAVLSDDPGKTRDHLLSIV